MRALKKNFFFFWPCHEACRVLVPQPGTEPVFLALKAPSPNHWTVREFPMNTLKNKFILQNLKEKLQVWFEEFFFQNHLRVNC